MIRAVRRRDINVAEGAFQLGAAVKDLKRRVGPLDPSKPKEEAKKVVAKPKLNPLEKEIKFFADEGMSDYEKIRLKNIQERFALFKQVRFDNQRASFFWNLFSSQSYSKQFFTSTILYREIAKSRRVCN